MSLLTKEQTEQVASNDEAVKSSFLQKILDLVNLQNVEHYRNLACELTIKLSQSQEDQKNFPERIHELEDKVSQNSNRQKITDQQDQEVCQQVDLAFLDEKPTTSILQDELNAIDEFDNVPYNSLNTKNPEVIKMHLDMLLKYFSFLSTKKIEKILPTFIQQKQKKELREEEFIKLWKQMKQGPGRKRKNIPSENQFQKIFESSQLLYLKMADCNNSAICNFTEQLEYFDK